MAFHHEQPWNDLPNPPAREVLETVATLKASIAAARSLERLRGTAARLPNPRVLLNGIVLQEAKRSSEVENIVTTNDELYRAAAGLESAGDSSTKEVLRYSEALWYGFEEIGKRPLTASLFVELVQIIRQTSVGIRDTPGTNLKSQRGEIIYTPPFGKEIIQQKLSVLEGYLYAEDAIDPLIKLAVMHYQFEAIHPFSDGNGRTGRILNVLYLVEKGLLDLPLLYLSQYILQNRAAYYAGLRSVTEKQDWQNWILFMLTAVDKTAFATCSLIEDILQQIADAALLFRATYPNAYRKELMEVIFSNPYCRIRFLEQQLEVTRQTASSYLQKMAELGVLREVRVGRDAYFVNDKMLESLSRSR